MKTLVFDLKCMNWSAAMDLTFTAVEICYEQAVDWSEKANRKRRR